jgi:hypothetical protein
VSICETIVTMLGRWSSVWQMLALVISTVTITFPFTSQPFTSSFPLPRKLLPCPTPTCPYLCRSVLRNSTLICYSSYYLLNCCKICTSHLNAKSYLLHGRVTDLFSKYMSCLVNEATVLSRGHQGTFLLPPVPIVVAERS